NRTRPQAFTLNNWQRATNATAILRPLADTASPTEGEGFSCNAGLCIARTGDAVTAHAQDEETAASACALAHVMVIDDATARNPCAGDVVVITKRDLARRGSAEIRFEKGALY